MPAASAGPWATTRSTRIRTRRTTPGSASNPRPSRSATAPDPSCTSPMPPPPRCGPPPASRPASACCSGLASPLPLPSFCGNRRLWPPATRPIVSRNSARTAGPAGCCSVGSSPATFSDAMDPAAFVRCNTVIAAPPLVPEIRLHLATEVTPIWLATEESLARDGLPPPFWAFAWAGGQALARYLLDRPEMVAGRDVLDFGSGSGLVAIAAAKAGAARVGAAEIDPFAAAAIAANAALNNVEIGMISDNLLDGDDGGWP